jgi:hypothetical protein
MRIRAIALLTVATAAGCVDMTPVPPYSPVSFRADVTQLIDAQAYRAAVAYLRSASPTAQAAFDGQGYLAVAEDMIVLPGAKGRVDFDPSVDWEFPGTSDAMMDMAWQRAATEFAAAYNRARDRQPGDLSP